VGHEGQRVTTPAPKLPPDALIAGQVWRILEARDETLMSGKWGLTTEADATIRLDPDAPQPRTLIHELMHAAELGLHTDISHDAVQALAAGLASALISRPVLAEWIAARARGDA